MSSSTHEDFKPGRDYSLVLWAGLKLPLVDEKGNVAKTSSAASPALFNDVRLSRTSFVEPSPISSHPEEVLKYADDDDDIACSEVVESPVGLLDLLEQGGFVPSLKTNTSNNDDVNNNNNNNINSAEQIFSTIPPQLQLIDSLYVLTPGNFASADFYVKFVRELRQRNPNLGVLVLGHAGIQSSDRNHRVGYSLRNYINLNAHFIYEVALNKNCESALKMMELARIQNAKKEENNKQNDDTNDGSSNSSTKHVTPRHPRLILSAHSVGAFILLKAIEQFTQIPRWNAHMNLERVCFYAPVIQFFKDAPAGDGAGKWVSKLGAGAIAYGCVLPFWLLPEGARASIFESFTGSDADFARQAAKMVRPSSVWNCLQLARKAFAEVKELDVLILNGLGKKLYCYFVQNDGWVPDSYIAVLRKSCPKITLVMEPDEKVGHSCCVTAPSAAAAALPFFEEKEVRTQAQEVK